MALTCCCEGAAVSLHLSRRHIFSLVFIRQDGPVHKITIFGDRLGSRSMSTGFHSSDWARPPRRLFDRACGCVHGHGCPALHCRCGLDYTADELRESLARLTLAVVVNSDDGAHYYYCIPLFLEFLRTQDLDQARNAAIAEAARARLQSEL